jgi:hypothetical protein
MKKYFAKYLPVEGEMKEGCIAKEKYSINPKIVEVVAINEDGMIKCKGDNLWYVPEALQTVKLFLCSRDIQVGDKVRGLDGSEEIIMTEGDKQLLFDGNIFKVIGEISPDATWVKEGDEFDEDDWKLVIPDPSWQFQTITLDKKWVGKQSTSFIQVKGLCDHFH